MGRRVAPYWLLRAFYGASAVSPHEPGAMKFAHRHHDADRCVADVLRNLRDPEVGEVTIKSVGWSTV